MTQAVPRSRFETYAVLVAVVLLAIGLLLVVVACTPPPAPPPPPPHAYLIGDSISYKIATDGGFAGFPYILEVHALPGQRLDDPTFSPDAPCVNGTFSASEYIQPDPRPLGSDLAAWYGNAAAPGDWIILQLGTNDLADGRRCIEDTWYASILWALARIPDDRCVAWVPIGTYGMTDRERLFNTFVWQLIHKRSCGVYIPWDRVTELNRGILYDGVHPTPEGGRFLVHYLIEGMKCRCDQVI